MAWGIIGALDEEVLLIKQHMTVERTERAYGSEYFVGTIGAQKVVVVCCSIGTINATACAVTLVNQFAVDNIVNVGISGSLCKQLEILDVVISAEVAFHDTDLDIIEKYYPFKRSFLADQKLQQLAVLAIDQLPNREFKYKVGKIATGDRFVNDNKLKEAIIADIGALCVEMEGAAIGQIASMSDIPFLIVRTLSDNADDDADKSYDNFLELAAKNSSDIILKMIEITNSI